MAQTLKNGYSLSFKRMAYFIYDNENVLVAKLPMVDKCFPLNWACVSERINFVKEDESRLWHCRYGHCNYNALA